MNVVNSLPEPANSHIGAIAFVEFGRVYGLPTLVGKGRIVAERVRHGITHLLIQPVEGMRFEKWVTEAEIRGYDWSQPSVIQIEKAVA